MYKKELIKRQKEEGKVYEKYKNNVEIKNSRKEDRRLESLLITSWGFGVLSVSSVVSTVFSIERNTRETDPE